MYHHFNIHKFYVQPTRCRYGAITYSDRPTAIPSAINPSKYSIFGITTTAKPYFEMHFVKTKAT